MNDKNLLNAYKPFNIKNKRPQVLLLGNGLNYMSSSKISWDDFIGYKTTPENKHIATSIPNIIKAFAACSKDDHERRSGYCNTFANYSYSPNEYVDRLTKLPFDAILTTNYTYELENSIVNGFPAFSPDKKRKYIHSGIERMDNKYCMHSFYRFNDSDNRNIDIWHIHGELRKPQSFILTHDEYARLINKILEYNSYRGNYYEKFSDSVRCKSWVDYFILGDIYILGLSLDFSEFDLWWLLGRRLREKTGQGKVTFFTPETADGMDTAITSVLKQIGVECESCGVKLTGDKEKDNLLYFEHYSRSLDYMHSVIICKNKK